MAALDAVDGSCSEDEMAKVFITGSSDGLGLMAGRLLAKQGHVVVLHARSEARAEGTRLALPQAEAVLVGDLSPLAAMRDVADQANGRGRFDAVIHNVGIGYREPRRVETVDGLSQLWAVNVLATLRAHRAHAQARPAGLSPFRHAHRRRPGACRP